MRALWIVSYAVSLSACGGGGGDGDAGPKPKVGYLKGPSIAGLRYQAADATPPPARSSPVTDSAGRYELTAETVRFFIGRVDFGSAPTNETLTWLQLGSQVQLANKALLLTISDRDGSIGNGINVSAELNVRAESWSVDFNSPTFVEDVQANILPDIQSVYGRAIVMPTPAQALESFASAFRCASALMYSGGWVLPPSPDLDRLYQIYTGSSGQMLTLVTTPNGRVVGHQQFSTTVSVLNGVADLPYLLRPGFSWERPSVIYSGALNDFREMQGYFSYLPIDDMPISGLPTGTMDGRRIAGSPSAVNRFSLGFSIGRVPYLLLVELDVNGRASATVIANGGKPEGLSGVMVGSQLQLNAASGHFRFDGEVQENTLTGTWIDSANGTSKIFTGNESINGCHT